MPPYFRRRFRGWDWFTPRAVRHLPWRERQQVSKGAWDAVRRRPQFRLTLALFVLGTCAPLAGQIPGPLNEPFVRAALSLLFLPVSLLALLWQLRLYRSALRQKLWEAGIRPGACFDCGYDLEGYEGDACPACDAPLLRQPDSSPAGS